MQLRPRDVTEAACGSYLRARRRGARAGPTIRRVIIHTTSVLRKTVAAGGETPAFVVQSGQEGVNLTTVFIDADACPVKNEIYRVAERCAVPV